MQVAKQALAATGGAIGQRRAPLSADDRGTLLGEAQLPASAAAAEPSQAHAIAGAEKPNIAGR